MYRCDLSSMRAAFVLLAFCVCAAAVSAQVQRNFPSNALRGDIAFVDAPEIRLNGQAGRLAPGARLRGPDNLLLVTGNVAGQQRYQVNYTLDTLGLVKDVWILRDEEIRAFWPRSASEAAALRFDPVAQSWSKP